LHFAVSLVATNGSDPESLYRLVATALRSTGFYARKIDCTSSEGNSTTPQCGNGLNGELVQNVVWRLSQAALIERVLAVP